MIYILDHPARNTFKDPNRLSFNRRSNAKDFYWNTFDFALVFLGVAASVGVESSFRVGRFTVCTPRLP